MLRMTDQSKMLSMIILLMVGFMVAYAAMFGFDKLREVIMQLEKKKE